MIYEDANKLDAVDTLPDIKKASELLNWKPEIDLGEGILRKDPILSIGQLFF